MFAMTTVLFTQSGCYGEFALVKKVYDWNGGLSSNKFVTSLLFWVLNIVPVYGVAAFIDVIILNLIEFWSGSNPMSMNEGDHEMQLATINGVDYRIDATKDTFTTTQLTGEQAGEVRIMKFDRNSLTWKYSDSEVCEQPVMTFLDDRAENVRVYTGQGAVDMATIEMENKDLLLAKYNTTKGTVTACAN